MTIEYTDERGNTHEVSHLKDVPDQYARSVVITGGEPKQADDEALLGETREAPVGGTSDPGFGTDMTLGDIGAPAVILVVVIIMWFTLSNFLGRVITVCVALLAAGWYFLIYVEEQKEKDKKLTGNEQMLEKELGGVAEKKKSTWKDMKKYLDEREEKRQKKSFNAAQDSGTSGSE